VRYGRRLTALPGQTGETGAIVSARPELLKFSAETVAEIPVANDAGRLARAMDWGRAPPDLRARLDPDRAELRASLDELKRTLESLT
jgi:hypothetical protein